MVSRAIAITPTRAIADFPGSLLERVIKAAFGTRRKQAAVALTAGLARTRSGVDAALKQVGIKATARAEEIAPEEYVALAQALRTE